MRVIFVWCAYIEAYHAYVSLQLQEQKLEIERIKRELFLYDVKDSRIKRIEEMAWDVVKVRIYKYDMIYINVYMYIYVCMYVCMYESIYSRIKRN